MFLAGDLDDGRERRLVLVNEVPYPVRDLEHGIISWHQFSRSIIALQVAGVGH